MKKISIIVITLLFVAVALAATRAKKPTFKQRFETLERQVENLTTRIEKLEIQLRPASSKNKKTLTAESEKKSISNQLEFDVVSYKRYGEEMLGVKVKITNISNRHVNSCDATCILQDAQGEKLTFQRHYVIKSIDGGLSPGASTYFEYVIDVRPELVKGVSFHIETLDW